MKPKKTSPSKPPAPAASWKLYAILFAALMIAGFAAYSPALHGPFLFDDNSLPFRMPGYSMALRPWLGAVRPLLMVTYWLNAQISLEATYSYHAVNVLFHATAAFLFFFVVRRLLELAGTREHRDLLAAIASAIFLLHPVQAESVAYIAGRPDSMSTMFVLAAFAVFLCRREAAVNWLRAAGVLLLFLLALLSKEPAIALVPLLLLTDYWWNPGFSFAGIRRNWKLYVPVVAGAAAGLAFLWELIVSSPTAGFALKDFTWYQYLFTQCRALWVYLRLFVLPYGQTLDYDFPISMNVTQHGAIFGLIGLAGVTALAWIWRKRYPLGAYGWFAFLVLMAPTSSILKIKDPIAERRMYLGMLGLLLIVVEVLRQAKLDRKALAGVLAAVSVLGFGLTYARAGVWSSDTALWEDTVAKSPTKYRARFQLASAYYHENRCDAAVQQFEIASRLQKPDYDLLVDWGLALDCLNRPDDAIAKLRQAAAIDPIAHVYTQIAMVYAKRQRWPEALDALAQAEHADARYPMIWVYKGGIHLSTNDAATAVQDYTRALALDPGNQQAQEGLAMAQRALAGAAR